MKHFKLKEFVDSPTAACLGIDNTPDAAAVDALRRLAENVLDPLREALGMPIYVNSGYRSPRLNAMVGGVKTSQHLKGEAADITTGTRDGNINLWRTLKRLRLPIDQAINEHGYAWIHVSYSSRHRLEYLTQIGH